MTTTAPELLALKRCGKCHEDKAPEDFPRDRSKRDGLASRCTLCNRAHVRQWATEHPERVAEYARRRHDEAPHFAWERKYVERARRYGEPIVIFRFTLEDLVARYGDECAWCGGPFQELDHAIPVAAGGIHDLSNARPSCRACNRATSAEAKAAKSHRKAKAATARAHQAAVRAGRSDLALAELRGQITTAELLAELATGTA